MFRMVLERVPGIRGSDGKPAIVLSAHCHDDLGLAVANSLAAIEAGVRQVECAVNGIGERAGNAALEELAAILTVRGDTLGFHPQHSPQPALPHQPAARRLHQLRRRTQ